VSIWFLSAVSSRSHSPLLVMTREIFERDAAASTTRRVPSVEPSSSTMISSWSRVANGFRFRSSRKCLTGCLAGWSILLAGLALRPKRHSANGRGYEDGALRSARGLGSSHEVKESHTVKRARDWRQKSIIASSFRTATRPMILPLPTSPPPPPPPPKPVSWTMYSAAEDVKSEWTTRMRTRTVAARPRPRSRLKIILGVHPERSGKEWRKQNLG
jgi:hypothetical protein